MVRWLRDLMGRVCGEGLSGSWRTRPSSQHLLVRLVPPQPPPLLPRIPLELAKLFHLVEWKPGVSEAVALGNDLGIEQLAIRQVDVRSSRLYLSRSAIPWEVSSRTVLPSTIRLVNAEASFPKCSTGFCG